MFQLALRLGRTVNELMSSMSAEEFEYWKAFSVFEPIGVLREDALFANVCKTLADLQVKNELTLRDFTVFNRNKAEPEPDQEQVMRNIKALFGALSAKSKA
ncbi:phage tail assembly protein T [Acinetobacter baumannii]|uniref:phage tail assembly protein T n=1 Tax=Acinetobacter sp. YH12043 TaxID=2601050 RepID=UPI0015D21EA3|nr:phage tail assembly protein T [Acinetobacter sp. YH12043]